MFALRITAKIGGTFLAAVITFLLFHIVIAIEQEKAVFLIKPGHKPENVVVDVDNLIHIPVFPQFIPIPQFDIGKALVVVMLQGSEIEVLIFQEVIAPTAISTMAVTDKDITAVGSKGENRGFLKGFLQAGIITHEECLRR